jgi:hypothetical protein
VKRICLALPTNRACTDAIAGLAAEAHYAAQRFDVEVHVLILDSSDADSQASHSRAVAAIARSARVIPHHIAEPEQRDFLRRLISNADCAKPDLLLDLMLPPGVSYGACTNRAFLYASALGCASVHRRDSDSRYQTSHGLPLFPIHHELGSLGRRASDAAATMSENQLDPGLAHRPVSLVGGSFIGELSVDLGEILERDAAIYHDLVSLWAPGHWPDARKRELVAQSFRGAGLESFVDDHSVLTVVDPMRIDMCNISFDHETYERVPLLPAVDTIGSDYFLMHLVESAGLPGVLHNRDIVNFYTPQRRTGAGFHAYHLRFAKFVLSMLYLNFIYERMAAAGPALLDGDEHVRPDAVVDLARLSTELDRGENVERLRVLTRCYRALGGKYGELAETLAARGPRLLDEAQADIEDFALLTESWAALVRASRSTAVGSAHRGRTGSWN